MERATAVHHLRKYCELVEEAQRQPWLSAERKAALKAASGHLPGVNAVLSAISPDFRQVCAHNLDGHVSALPVVRRALGPLDDWNQIASNQWSGGGPALPLSVADPMVWGPAAPLWELGKYRQAVADAATSVNHFTQKRLDRYDISDSDLMAQAFSDKPPQPGEPRLRCPGGPKSITVQSMQRGAMLTSMGVFQAVRNPAIHLTGGWNPVTASEQLVPLSMVAGWVRHWDPARYTPPPPDLSVLCDSAVARGNARVVTSKPPGSSAG